MASGDQIAYTTAAGLHPQNGPVYPVQLVPSNGLPCVPLMKNGNAFFFEPRIPSSATVSTGLTFSVEVTDDGKTAADLGKAVVIGVTVKRLVSGTDTYDITASAATEATATVTLNATTGVVVVATIAIANAALDSIVVGDRFLVQVRRVVANAADTAVGTVLLSGVAVINT